MSDGGGKVRRKKASGILQCQFLCCFLGFQFEIDLFIKSGSYNQTTLGSAISSIETIFILYDFLVCFISKIQHLFSLMEFIKGEAPC